MFNEIKLQTFSSGTFMTRGEWALQYPSNVRAKYADLNAEVDTRALSLAVTLFALAILAGCITLSPPVLRTFGEIPSSCATALLPVTVIVGSTTAFAFCILLNKTINSFRTCNSLQAEINHLINDEEEVDYKPQIMKRKTQLEKELKYLNNLLEHESTVQ